MQWLSRGEPHLPEGTDWLTPFEARRASSMRYTKRRTEYLVRRLTAKHAVLATLGWTPDVATLARVSVPNRLTGAPYVEIDGEPLGLDVSLTDRAGWGVCLVGSDIGAVGCDVEIVEPRSAGFVSDFLTPGEADVVRSASDEEQRQVLANLFWSAKESALKVLRTGLRRDTRTVEVLLDDPGLRSQGVWSPLRVVSTHADGRAVMPGWWLRDGVWLLSVCYAEPAAAPVALEQPSALRRATPVHSWMARPLVE
ncbi:MAG: 4'-phosphopantetheinyl transferase superfamily protein [Jiangellales bacterium]